MTDNIIFSIVLVMIITQFLVLLMPILGLIFGYYYGIDIFFKITFGGWGLLIIISLILDQID